MREFDEVLVRDKAAELLTKWVEDDLLIDNFSRGLITEGDLLDRIRYLKMTAEQYAHDHLQREYEEEQESA